MISKLSNKPAKFLLVFATLLMLCFQAAAAEYAIIYTGNLDGELEPCGCSVEGNSGGILRRAQKLDELRAENPDIFAISAGGLIYNGLTEEKLKSEYIFSGYAEIGYDAVAVQWADIRYGNEFATESGIPWVSSNWLTDEFIDTHVVTHEEQSLAFFGWLAPEDSPYRAMQGQHRVVDGSASDLANNLRQARNNGHLTVLSSTYSYEHAKEFFPLELVDILMIKAAYEEYPDPQMLDGTLVLQPGSRGLRLGKLKLSFEAGKGITQWQHEVISLPPAVPNAKRLEAWYQAYNDDVAKAYEASIAARKASLNGLKSPFIGEKGCKSCHSQAHKIFKGTRHSKAFSTLERVNKAFDPECITCHSVGFNKPGGFVDVESTKHLKNVQCESCHGAGRAHAESAGQAELGHHGWLPQEMCAQCHTQPHSPSFNFENYFTEIEHRNDDTSP